MAINIQSKTDYSYLFSSLNTSSTKNSTSNLSWLGDYAMIKNGSYGKLMKAYYSETAASEVKSIASTEKSSKANTTSLDDTETIAKVKSTTDELKESADKLLEKGSESVFGKGNTEDIYSAVNEFVKDYNSVLDTMDDVNSTSILSRAKSMVQNTAVYKDQLSNIGITINEDNSLSVNKEAFLKADEDSVKNLFNTTGSFAYKASASSSLMNYAAEQEADKAATYTNTGSYGNTYSAGNLFDSLF
ncbi:MAG: hypothetical protein IJX63_02995 [Lachnospiraceae bacterium]|nr:hypothetical protein [Lachnospiraceae bacterium]